MLMFLNMKNYLYAYITEEDGDRVLRLLKSNDGEVVILDPKVILPADDHAVELAVTGEAETGSFHYRLPNETEWKDLATDLDLTFLSGGFTGNFIAIASHDMNQYKGSYADFDYFTYLGKDK